MKHRTQKCEAGFDRVQSLHQTTLRLKCNILLLRKLLEHNTALYWPTARQIFPGHLLACIAGWLLICGQSAHGMSGHHRTQEFQSISSSRRRAKGVGSEKFSCLAGICCLPKSQRPRRTKTKHFARTSAFPNLGEA